MCAAKRDWVTAIHFLDIFKITSAGTGTRTVHAPVVFSLFGWLVEENIVTKIFACFYMKTTCSCR